MFIHLSLSKVFTAAVVLLCFNDAFAFTHEAYTFTSPAGWKEEAKMLGTDVLYVGSFNSTAVPVITVMTLKKELKASQLRGFLTESIKSDFKTRNITGFKIKAQGKPAKLRSPAEFVDVEYSGPSGPMRDYSVIILGKNQYHFLTYSARSNEFDFYYKDVASLLSSFTLK